MALQESLYQAAETKQVFERAGDLWLLWKICRGLEICPRGRNQRLASVRQNQNEIQAFLPDGVPENFKRLSCKRMMAASDRYTLRIVPEVGSLRWFPSTG